MKASGVRLFVNGNPAEVEIESDTLSGTIEPSVPMMIGPRDGQSPFNGLVFEIKTHGMRIKDNYKSPIGGRFPTHAGW